MKGNASVKSANKSIVFALVLVALAANAYAQTQPVQLQQMVEQLQKTPTDNTLRDKIIKFAVEMKPPPALPEEATRRMARGEAAFESAKVAQDYDKAIAEYQAAANAAPWYADAYFNLGLTQEKTGKAKEAMESFRFYLLAAPDAKDAADIKKRLYKLEYAAEQQTQAKVELDKRKAIDDQANRFVGSWYRGEGDGRQSFTILRDDQGLRFVGMMMQVPTRDVVMDGESLVLQIDDLFPITRNDTLAFLQQGTGIDMSPLVTTDGRWIKYGTSQYKGTLMDGGRKLSFTWVALPPTPLQEKVWNKGIKASDRFGRTLWIRE